MLCNLPIITTSPDNRGCRIQCDKVLANLVRVHSLPLYLGSNGLRAHRNFKNGAQINGCRCTRFSSPTAKDDMDSR